MELVHHACVVVIFELQQIIRWINEKKRFMFFNASFESQHRFLKEWYFALASQFEQVVVLVSFPEGNPEVSWIHPWIFVDVFRGKVTHDLIAKEIERDLPGYRLASLQPSLVT